MGTSFLLRSRAVKYTKAFSFQVAADGWGRSQSYRQETSDVTLSSYLLVRAADVLNSHSIWASEDTSGGV